MVSLSVLVDILPLSVCLQVIAHSLAQRRFQREDTEVRGRQRGREGETERDRNRETETDRDPHSERQ